MTLRVLHTIEGLLKNKNAVMSHSHKLFPKLVHGGYYLSYEIPVKSKILSFP